jgi:hypothetical protein
MSLRRLLAGTGLMCAFVFGVSGAMAQEHEDHSGHDHAKGQDGDKAQDHAAEMEAWMAMATPGPEHANLKYCVGEWKASLKHWMEPGAEPAVSVGKEVNTEILGGRFVQTHFTGDFMGSPFEGHGYIGYDRIKKKYVSTWIDCMGTQVMMQWGDYDAATKTYTFLNEMTKPDGTPMKGQMIDKITGPDTHVMTMYHEMDGKMVKAMEISYERAGNASAMAE